ncbi:NUDIX hydrolase [Chondromyces apiculatus]|uniref:GDP-mannose pyrophosphatase n=1 Tax=Chondromyces apiculatus DSM 436 TaxID=1192034 RepID=A0A017TCD8_9BACT|nr:NUDIX hydrolase [Chondromyces apiculatus]EYF06542.1 ADP-ribose pyrophosphatase [Chondromyces apiculatus DSM 436]
MPLPPLPRLALRLVEAVASRDEPGFLSLQRRVLRVEMEDGSLSEPFVYDAVGRERLDAVVIVPHFRDAAGQVHVYLRSALRPPVEARPRAVWPVPERETLGAMWEVPAGLVEVDERSPEGLRRCAARELHEEAGFAVDPQAVGELGPSSFPAPGVMGERHFFFHVEVDPARQIEPPEDGSPLERGAKVVAVPLVEALELVRRGEIEDAKTELALRRLAEIG